ncbi:DUF448 domain-containing protein [Trichloromonas sp.]|uniref:DUF448 domain-containing protein n=1 Tax=Trichloromonas sp. TaxID=3069249 RepID=UPI002A4D5325|nr:DUF448 domain-containing protein [Trichloromonas sp.]
MIATRHTPKRTCLGCRQVLEQHELVRYVLAPDGELLVDYRHRLPGRGVYTCMNPQCIRQAVQRRQFQRAFRRELLAIDPERLNAALRAAIETKIISLVGMARKSGIVLSGARLVLDALAMPGQIAIVMLAGDVSAGIADKVVASASYRGIPIWRLLDKEQLGRMLGKEERSVIALKTGALAESVKTEVLRYKQMAGEI